MARTHTRAHTHRRIQFQNEKYQSEQLFGVPEGAFGWKSTACTPSHVTHARVMCARDGRATASAAAHTHAFVALADDSGGRGTYKSGRAK